MSYSEDSEGNVVLRMTRQDYERVLMIFGVASATVVSKGVKCLLPLDEIIRTLNRLNEGNPNYTPYAAGEETRG